MIIESWYCFSEKKKTRNVVDLKAKFKSRGGVPCNSAVLTISYIHFFSPRSESISRIVAIILTPFNVLTSRRPTRAPALTLFNVRLIREQHRGNRSTPSPHHPRRRPASRECGLAGVLRRA